MDKYLKNVPFVRYFNQCVTSGLPNTKNGQISHNLPFVRYFKEGEGEGEGFQLEVSQLEVLTKVNYK